MIETLNKVVYDSFVKYNGCLIEIVGKEFKVGNKFYKSLEEAKKSIDDVFIKLNNSIK